MNNLTTRRTVNTKNLEPNSSRQDLTPARDGYKKVVAHVITGLQLGGAERTLFRLLSEDRNHQHIVVSLTKGGTFVNRLKNRGVRVIELDVKKSPKELLRGLQLVRETFSQVRPDVVQTWMYHADFLGGLAARSLRIKAVIWNVRSSVANLKSGKRTTWLLTRVLALMSIFIPKRIVYCGNTPRSEHEKIGYARSKGIVISNGYPPDEILPDPVARMVLRTRLNIAERTPVFGLVARYHPKKNHLGFLDACSKLQSRGLDFHVILAGSGINKSNVELTEAISGLGLTHKVSLIGEVDKISQVMSAFDFLVMPSLSGEGFPNVVAEAMLTEIPCIVGDIGDSARIVDDSGWIFKSGSTSRLVEAMTAALAEEELSYLKRAKKSRTLIVNRFGVDAMVASYATLYATL